MKGMLRGVAALALATVLFTSAVEAQGARFGIGGTYLVGLDDQGSEFGVIGAVSFGGSESSPIGFRIDVSYIFDPNVLLFTGNVIYNFKTSEMSKFAPYIIGTGGYLTNDSFEGGDLVVGGGAGFNIQMTDSSIQPFVEGRFLNQFAEDPLGSVKSLQISAGIKIGSK